MLYRASFYSLHTRVYNFQQRLPSWTQRPPSIYVICFTYLFSSCLFAILPFFVSVCSFFFYIIYYDIFILFSVIKQDMYYFSSSVPHNTTLISLHIFNIYKIHIYLYFIFTTLACWKIRFTLSMKPF